MGGCLLVIEIRSFEVEHVQFEWLRVGVDSVFAAFGAVSAPVKVHLRENVLVFGGGEWTAGKEWSLAGGPFGAENDWGSNVLMNRIPKLFMDRIHISQLKMLMNEIKNDRCWANLYL